MSKKNKSVNTGFGSRKHRKAMLNHNRQSIEKANASPFTMAVDAAAAVVGSFILRGGVKEGTVEMQLGHFVLAVRDKLEATYNSDGSFKGGDDE